MSGHFIAVSGQLFLAYADEELDAIKKVLVQEYPEEAEWIEDCATVEDIWMGDFPMEVYDGVIKIE